MPKTRGLLACGAAAGPLFILVVLVQDYTRAGFDPRRHPLSMLGLGDLGWIQIANFTITGLLFIAAAVGLWRSLHPGPGGTWGPILIGTYGIGLVIAGIFVTEPAWGYPPGAPADPPHVFGLSSVLHNIGALVVFSSLTAACFVFARRFTAYGDRRWALYCAATGVALPALLVGGSLARGDAADSGPVSLSLRAAALLGWGWASLIAARVRAASTPPEQASLAGNRPQQA
ncbi:MAG TPA: DUF998 domain-containing protein [Nonomuraea sp.]|nr:DUF998 domain-containing protein [Nonomuraea sp.]